MRPGRLYKSVQLHSMRQALAIAAVSFAALAIVATALSAQSQPRDRDDGLIDVANLAHLDAIRWDPTATAA